MEPLISASPPFRHSVYGLTIESWIPFPELEPALEGAKADVVFRLGDVPAELKGCRQTGARFQIAPGRLLLWMDHVARYLVNEGREIVVQPESGALESDVRLFLLCSPVGALLHQRGFLPLHASAIATPRGAAVLMGGSGVGKSTLAASFQRRGFRVLADDISAVRFAPDGVPWVMPGLPQLKLWPDAISRLGSNADDLARLRPQVEKRAFPFRENFHSEPLPLDHIYFLRVRAARDVGVERISGMDRLPRLMHNTYRSQFVPGLGLSAPFFESASRLANAVAMTCVSRGADGDPGLVADRIAQDFGA
jgi:hypothetical protein